MTIQPYNHTTIQPYNPFLETNYYCPSAVMNYSSGGIADFNLTGQISEFGYSKNQVIEGRSFRNVKPGDWIFMAHMNKFTQLAISKLQQWFKFGDNFSRNITHMGVVTEVKETEIRIAEIPAYGSVLSENSYSLNEMLQDEDFLFSKGVSQGALAEASVKVGKVWANQEGYPASFNQYNLKGLTQIPFTSDRTFSAEDQQSLLSALMDYKLGRSPRLVQKEEVAIKNYFCSELAVELHQLASFITQFPSIASKVETQLVALDLDTVPGREKALEILRGYSEEIKAWEIVTKEKLFELSSRSSTPSALLDMAVRHSGALRVRNPDAKTRFNDADIKEDEIVAYTEYMAVKILDRALDGTEILETDPDVEKFLYFLETKIGYSKESLQCFIKTCKQTNNFSSCVENCLQDTLTWQEKLFIFFFSREINRGTSQLLNNPAFREFVKQPSRENLEKLHVESWDPSVASAMEQTFPADYSAPMSSLENVLARQWMQSMDKKMLIKYFPLALAYNSPSEEIAAFLKDADMSSVQLAMQLQGLLNSAPEMNSIKGDSRNPLQTLSSLGILDAKSPIIQAMMMKMGREAGYSEDTLKCFLDKLVTNNVEKQDVEDCLTETLSVKEKINVFLASHFVNTGVGNLVQNEQFIQFVRGERPSSSAVAKGPMSEDVLVNYFFPPNQGIISSIENYGGRLFFSNSLAKGLPSFVFKDVFLGLAYDFHSEPVQKFMEQQKLSREELVLKIYSWMKQHT